MSVRHNRKAHKELHLTLGDWLKGRRSGAGFFLPKTSGPQLGTAFRKFKDTPWDLFTQPPTSKNNPDS